MTISNKIGGDFTPPLYDTSDPTNRHIWSANIRIDPVVFSNGFYFENAFSHELGHGHALGECYSCPAMASVMGNVANGRPEPSPCDNQNIGDSSRYFIQVAVVASATNLKICITVTRGKRSVREMPTDGCTAPGCAFSLPC